MTHCFRQSTRITFVTKATDSTLRPQCKLQIMSVTIALTFLLAFAYQGRAWGAKICPPGSKVSRLSSCEPCNYGEFQDVPNTSRTCKKCPRTLVSTERGATKCTPCGDQEVVSDNRCVCMEGFGRDTNGNCVSCVKQGKFYIESSNKGQICISCKSGTAPVHRCISHCGPCGSGKTVLRAGFYCEKCPSNTYKEGFGLGPCIPCPQGSFSSPGNSYKENCIKCPPGERPLRDLYGGCGKCAPGKEYSSRAQYCYACPANSVQPKVGTFEECIQCPRGTYSALGEGVKCFPCPEGTVYLGKKNCGKCPPGTVYDREFSHCAKRQTAYY